MAETTLYDQALLQKYINLIHGYTPLCNGVICNDPNMAVYQTLIRAG